MALLTWARYKTITGDTTTAQAVAEAAIADAQELVEDYLHRPLESASRTETLAVYQDGRVYPKATPITVAPSGYTVDGMALVGATPMFEVAWPYPASPPSTLGGNTVAVTYTGGWTSSTIPQRLERLLARAAKGLLDPTASLVPAGAKSVSLGDASVTYDRPPGAALPADIALALVPYKRRRAA